MIASLTAISLYAVGLYLRWRARDAADSHRPVAYVTAAALVAHGAAVFGALSVTGGIDLGLVPISNAIAFVLVGVVAIASTRLPVENLYLFLFPISIAALFIHLLVPATDNPISHMTSAQIAHIIISLAAYTALMMAACQSLLVALQERHLRTPGRPVLALLPPMETMERLLMDMIWIGFVLLSGAIISGYLFFDDIFARQVLHHIVLTSLSWLAYLVFLTGRYLFGWRGLTAVRWTLSAFTLLLLGYLGTKFVLEYVLSR